MSDETKASVRGLAFGEHAIEASYRKQPRGLLALATSGLVPEFGRFGRMSSKLAPLQVPDDHPIDPAWVISSDTASRTGW